MTQIFIKILSSIFVVHLDGENAKTVHPSNETRKHCLTTTRHTNKKYVSLRLSEHAVDTKDVYAVKNNNN